MLPFIDQTGLADAKVFTVPEVGGAKFSKLTESVVDDAIVSTGQNAPECLLIVVDKTNQKVGFYLAEATVLTAIEADASFSTTLTTDTKINVAYSTDQYVVENKLGSTIDVSVTCIAI